MPVHFLEASGPPRRDDAPRQGGFEVGTQKRIKTIISMIGLDGHTTGAEIVARILRDAGIEVVYLGVNQTPEMIVEAAVQEDVDAIGISSHASNYGQIEAMLELLKKKGLEHVCVFCGGTIPRQKIPGLKEKGVEEVFPPGSRSEAIVDFLVSRMNRATESSHS
jgi:methylmalonyl-CoA mutase, C-terminal domain